MGYWGHLQNLSCEFWRWGSSQKEMNRSIGVSVILAGIALLVIGLLIYSGGLNWFGRLPGDIRYQSDRIQVYVPIVSMLLISAALSLIFYLVRKFLY